ncbi:MAG: hypothetical protein Aurels2KO_31600 [Aureliella sp.]
MARNKDEFGKAPGGASKLKRFVLFFLLAAIVLLALLPTLVLNRTVLTPMANRFAGIAPLKIEIDSAGGGWLSAVRLGGLKLVAPDGKILASVAEIRTQKTVTSWALNSSDLDTIAIRGLEAIVVCKDGTSDLEQALAPLLKVDPNAEIDETPVAAAPMSGRIEISDSKLMLAEAGREEQWIVELDSANMTLPEAGQWLGPIDLAARIGDASNVSGATPGAIDATVAPEGAGLSINGQFSSVPLNFWHVVRARIPSLPVDELSGVLSAKLTGQYADVKQWGINIEQASLTDVRIDAPSLVGSKPALLRAVNVQGQAALTAGTLTASGVQLQCDFANVAANADMPWPIVLPSVNAPLMQNSVIDARGTIDLPKLISAAETLIPVRDGLDLGSGTAQFVLKQDRPAGQARAAIASLELSNLTATVDGQQIVAKAPMKATVVLNDGDTPSGEAALQSEFATLKGGGSLESGTLNANLDLAKLYAEATNWIELPFTQMAGTVQTDVKWALAESTRLQADLKLATSELLISSESGQTREPAWTGVGSAEAKVVDGAITWLNRAKFDLSSSTEQLSIEVSEPIALTTPEEESIKVAPAAFTASLVGDLAGWQRRSSLLLSEPLSVQVAGNMRLAAQGRLDMTHAQITAANWSAEPLQVSTEGMGFADSRLIGHFKGLVDTSDIMQLRVDDLTVQSTAISLVASDQVAGDGKGRVGQAAFRVDLARLMNNVQTPPAAVDPATGVPPSKTVATGMAGGNVNWTMSDSITLNADANVQDLQIFSVTAEKPQGELLWSEPTVGIGIRGEHTTETGAAVIDALALQTQWLTYNGRLVYDPGEQSADPALGGGQSVQTIQPPSLQLVALSSDASSVTTPATRPASLNLAGQIDYDCGLLSNKLVPLTGGQFSMAGRRQVPLNFNLVFPSDASTPMLRGLDATTQLAWTEAEAVGIQIGEAVVPVEIRGGRMASKAEMPVSGGALRWDLKTDLAADEMVIDLAPMTVIDNVALTEQMCKGWLKYIAPMVAEAASVDGRLTLDLAEARLVPSNPAAQTVSGTLQIFNARVGPGPLSSGVLAVVSQVEAVRKGQIGQASSYEKRWLDLPEQRIAFRMVDGQVYHENLNVRVGDVQISTAGSVGVDGRMNLVANMPIPNDWADKSPLLQGLRGQSLQFPMGGSLSQPQINTDFLRQFGREAVRGAAQGLLQQGLSKGLGRLFGPPPEGGDN